MVDKIKYEEEVKKAYIKAQEMREKCDNTSDLTIYPEGFNRVGIPNGVISFLEPDNYPIDEYVSDLKEMRIIMSNLISYGDNEKQIERFNEVIEGIDYSIPRWEELKKQGYR